MLFNSYFFWLFFALVAVLYWRLAHRGQNRLLLVASYYFYACWDWRFLALIATSTTIDYFVALAIARTSNRSRRKRLMLLSISASIGILGFFKYFGFFSRELDGLLHGLGLPSLIPRLDILLPVGISFYTFQTMSYTIDVYRRHCKPTRNYFDFALFVSFFPQLVAGPIERASHFLPQILKPRVYREGDFAHGLYMVIIGLFQKVFVADTMAALVNGVFATPSKDLHGSEILLATYAFAFQIYGDFAGYSSIARGVARWLGFDLMVNFRRPYFAASPSEFWQRWHISLSQWLRDYVYIPLGGNRGGNWSTYRNLLLTMLLGGLWHGANWTFIAWGAFHGLLLSVYRYFESSENTPRNAADAMGRWDRFARQLLMFNLICFGWLLFRADSMAQVMEWLTAFGSGLAPTPLAKMMLGMILFCVSPLMLFELWEEHYSSAELLRRHWALRAVVYAAAIQLMIYFPPPMASQFIYFQF